MNGKLRRALAVLVVMFLVTSTAMAEFLDIGESGDFDLFGIQMVYYANVGQVSGIAGARDALLSGNGDIVDDFVPYANHADVGGSAGGGYTLTEPKDPWPGLPAGDTDDFVWLYNGHIFVPADGEYTFGFDGDDAHRLTVEGANFNVNGGGGQVGATPDTLEFPTDTGDAFTTGATPLTAGVHRIQFYGNERGGGAFTELFSAVGDVSTARWLRVGDDSVLPEEVIQPAIHLAGPVVVGNGPDASNFPEIRDTALANLGNGPTGTSDNLILIDHAPSGCPNSAGNPIATEFPNTQEMPGVDLNNFTTAILGELVVDNGNADPDEVLDLTIALLSDDAAQLVIPGVNFTGTAGGGPNIELVDVDGTMALTADADTCNTDALGHISIPEGTYQFEGYHRENGGNAGWQVWVADGTLNAYSSTVFSPITSSVDPVFVPGNTGFRLVPEDFMVVGPNCDFNGDSACDVADIDSLGKVIIAGTNEAAFDVNGDGVVDIADQDMWREIAATENGFAEPYLNGDANLDGSVLVGDLNIVGTNWQGSPDPWGSGDFNVDGVVDVADLNLLALNWQDSIPLAAAGQAVPEPSSLALLALAGIALLLRRR